MFDPNLLDELRARLPDHEVTLVEGSREGIYGMGGDYPSPDVYLLFDGGNTAVAHQYGCNGCCQYKGTDIALVAINGPLADELARAMGCNCDDDEIRAALRQWLPDAEVGYSSEALASVRSAELGDFQVASFATATDRLPGRARPGKTLRTESAGRFPALSVLFAPFSPAAFDYRTTTSS